MAALVRSNPVEVQNRLAQFGFTLAELLEVVDAMAAGRNGCTENDPIGAPGWTAYKDGTRRLREIARSKGWEKDDSDQVPWVLSRGIGIRIAVCNTDDATGVEERSPQNRNRKGPAADNSVEGNQGSLFDYREDAKIVSITVPGKQPGVVVSWYLCVYSDGDARRAELSCPIAAEGGFFTDFHERIILIGPDDPGTKVKRRGQGADDSDDGAEFDIPVRRK